MFIIVIRVIELCHMVNLYYIPFVVHVISKILKKKRKNLIQKNIHVIILPVKVAGRFSMLPATAEFYPHLA